jgi:hypothetical protein
VIHGATGFGWDAVHFKPQYLFAGAGVPLDAQRAAATLMETAVRQALLDAYSPSH